MHPELKNIFITQNQHKKTKAWFSHLLLNPAWKQSGKEWKSKKINKASKKGIVKDTKR